MTDAMQSVAERFAAMLEKTEWLPRLEMDAYAFRDRPAAITNASLPSIERLSPLPNHN